MSMDKNDRNAIVTLAALLTMLAAYGGGILWVGSNFATLHAGVENNAKAIAELKEDNAKAIAGLKEDNAKAIAELRADTARDIAELRADNAKAVAELRTDIREIRTDIQEMRGDIAELREDIGELRGVVYSHIGGHVHAAADAAPDGESAKSTE